MDFLELYGGAVPGFIGSGRTSAEGGALSSNTSQPAFVPFIQTYLSDTASFLWKQ